MAETTAIAVRNAPKCDQATANELIRVLNEIRRECCLDALKNASKNVSVTRSLARFWNAIWPVSGRETNEINSNAKRKSTPSQPLPVGIAAILDPGIQVTFRKVGI
jgi:hypothetical protein